MSGRKVYSFCSHLDSLVPGHLRAAFVMLIYIFEHPWCSIQSCNACNSSVSAVCGTTSS